MIKDFDITKTKLVIWDLDDTFWDGTLSEGGVCFKKEHLQLIDDLTTKGIMNSICSKNDLLNVKAEFITQGYIKYWQLFVFPSINWLPKGQRVKNIIESMQLREENVIVIDDNETNLEEIKYYCPKIMTAMPNQIKKIIQELYLVNDYDFEHIRLKQYKILEAKNKDKLVSNSSNEEFLKNSKIRLCIKHDCIENIDRIVHLNLRTNQLNFTKNRVNKETLGNVFNQKEKYDSGYVIVEDKYGNYGICGFYALNKENNTLEHFLFSCRIMNMGVEQFVYNYLNKPNVQVKYPVSSSLEGDVDWIELVDNIQIKQKEEVKPSGFNILFKGACDLYSAITYIGGDCNIDTEFPYWNKELMYISAHTHPAFIEQTHRLSDEKILLLSQSFPYHHPDEFKTDFFNPKYDIVVLSLLQATFRGIYINKTDGRYVEYGFTNCDITDENNWDKVLASLPDNQKERNISILKEFKQNYTFAGNPPIDLLMKNLEYIRSNLSENTHLILILGSEIDTDKLLNGYEGACESHIVFNKYVRDFAKKHKNTELLEITDLIKSDEDYTDCINHFSRRVYAEIAKKVINIVNNDLGKQHLFFKEEK